MDKNNIDRTHYKNCEIKNFAHCLQCAIVDVFMTRIQYDDNPTPVRSIAYATKNVNDWYDKN